MDGGEDSVRTTGMMLLLRAFQEDERTERMPLLTQQVDDVLNKYATFPPSLSMAMGLIDSDDKHHSTLTMLLAAVERLIFRVKVVGISIRVYRFEES